MRTLQTPVGALRCWDHDDITRSLELGEFWDAHLKEAFDQTPCDGWALDLGANVGFFTRYLAERFEQVLAVEAHPETAKILGYNTGMLPNVQIVCAAAYDRAGILLELANSQIHGWGEPDLSMRDLDTLLHAAGISFVEDPSQQHPMHETRVSTVRVDDLVPAEATVRLIKVDVQGAALRALVGAEGVISRCRPRIVFEFEKGVSECRGDFWADYTAWFEGHQYDLQSVPGPWSDFLAVPQ